MKPSCLFSAVFVVVSVGTLAVGQTNTPATAALAELTKPAKRIPFKEVILATTHHRILDFDNHNAAHRALFLKLSTVAAAAVSKARTQGIFSTRANEAGNHMEVFVKAALKEAGLPARTPVTTKGDAQTTGYPDVEILSDPPCYLELKTYNATMAASASFAFSQESRPAWGEGLVSSESELVSSNQFTRQPPGLARDGAPGLGRADGENATRAIASVNARGAA